MWNNDVFKNYEHGDILTNGPSNSFSSMVDDEILYHMNLVQRNKDGNGITLCLAGKPDGFITEGEKFLITQQGYRKGQFVKVFTQGPMLIDLTKLGFYDNDYSAGDAFTFISGKWELLNPQTKSLEPKTFLVDYEKSSTNKEKLDLLFREIQEDSQKKGIKLKKKDFDSLKEEQDKVNFFNDILGIEKKEASLEEEIAEIYNHVYQFQTPTKTAFTSTSSDNIYITLEEKMAEGWKSYVNFLN